MTTALGSSVGTAPDEPVLTRCIVASGTIAARLGHGVPSSEMEDERCAANYGIQLLVLMCVLVLIAALVILARTAVAS